MRVMQDLLDSLLEWCVQWKTKINALKSQALLFYPHTHKNRRKPVVNIYYEEGAIPEVESLKYLGVFFDPKLQWNTHIKYAIGKAKQRTAMLTSIISDKTKLSEETRQQIYTALIRPIITYGAPCWLGAAMAYKRDLLRYERNRLRHIFKIPRYIKTENVYKAAEGKLPHLQLFLQKLAQKFATSCQSHQNPQIAALNNYNTDFGLVGRRTNQYLRNLPLQVPIDVTLLE